MSVFLLYLLKRQLCTDSVNPSCDDSASNVHPASTKPTDYKTQSSGKEANEKTKTKKNTACVLPSRKNLNPKTVTEKSLRLAMSSTPGVPRRISQKRLPQRRRRVGLIVSPRITRKYPKHLSNSIIPAAHLYCNFYTGTKPTRPVTRWSARTTTLRTRMWR